MTWLVNGKTIARKIKNRNHGTTTSTNNAVADGKEGDFGCETIIECPYCGNVLEEGNVSESSIYIHDHGLNPHISVSLITREINQNCLFSR